MPSAIHASNLQTQSATTTENLNVTLASTTPSAITTASFAPVIDTFVPTSPFVSQGLKLTAPTATLSTLEDEPTSITGFVIDRTHSGPVTVTLSASSTLTLGSTAGLSFAVGTGVADHTMTFSGSVDNVNAALAGLTYTPSEQSFGTGQVNFTVTDGVETITGTLTVDIASVNDPPVLDLLPSPGMQLTGTTASFTGGAVTVAPQLTLSDVDSATLAGATVILIDPQVGDVLSLQGQSGTSGTLAGGISFSISGSSVTFAHVSSLANYQAALLLVQYNNTTASPSTTDRIFTFQIDDGGDVNNIAIATATVIVEGINHAPVANNDTLAAVEDTPAIYTAAQLLGNDTDVDGNPLTIASVTSGTGGTAVLNGNGTVTFTPTANFNGAASFSYTASDGTASSNTATVTVNVAAVNDAPVAVADTLAATEDTPVTYTAAQLLGNDTDVDGTTLLTIASVTSGTGGTAVLNANGTVTFTPNANFNGAASFSYTASDGPASSNTATVTVNVAAVNDAPVAIDDTLAATEDTPVDLHGGAAAGQRHRRRRQRRCRLPR